MEYYFLKSSAISNATRSAFNPLSRRVDKKRKVVWSISKEKWSRLTKDEIEEEGGEGEEP